MKYRVETDIIGEKYIPENALYGINSKRATENFPHSKPFNINWFKSIAIVKYSYYSVYANFKSAAAKKFPNIKYDFIDDKLIADLQNAALELSEGKHFEQFIVPAISGGAGTSINMNVNEIIANLVISANGKILGDYEHCDPLNHANIYQSTNDVIPSALKIAIMNLLNILEDKINFTRQEFERLESIHRNSMRIGYTQMQEAVPTTYGRLFSVYSEALSRDWWRVSKGFERIKVLNLGGSAIGTSLTVPRYFLMELVPKIQEITGLPVARAENMSDATSNLDSFVEVHAIIKAHAVNLEKIANDLRLLGSDIAGNKILLPKVQQGSSIMPGKVNPVISEFIISAANQIYANDMIISNLAAQGTLELNAYIPTLGNAILESIELLIACNQTMTDNLLKGIEINFASIDVEYLKSTAVTTVLVPYIGYKKSEMLAIEMLAKKINIIDANHNLKLIDEEKLLKLLEPSNILKEGFSLNDL